MPTYGSYEYKYQISEQERKRRYGKVWYIGNLNDLVWRPVISNTAGVYGEWYYFDKNKYDSSCFHSIPRQQGPFYLEEAIRLARQVK